MIALLAILFALAVALPLLHRFRPQWTGFAGSGVVALCFAGLLAQMPRVFGGDFPTERIAALPDLGLEWAFRLDGLSLLFALLIVGIGALILLYTHGYLHGHPQQGRFFLYITAFMASMLGVVLADNFIVLFVFWELTSFTSYLLIGFDHEREAARKAALQAMLVTVLGGLFLLAGLVLLGQAAGTFSFSALAGSGETVRAHAHYPFILGLVAVGAFTKSAQVPFHFWLPNAMQAPTPASAYLHSSTMVKAGIYLLARLHPTLGGTTAWSTLLLVVGGLTFATGALMAAPQKVMKRMLAYSTVAALGAMVMLLGVGTAGALKAMAAFVLAHGLYKAALFMVAGTVAHETHETDLTRIGGLRRAMPITFACALVAGLSMGGFPPFFGFVAKETWLAGVEHLPILILLTVLGGALFVLVGLRMGLGPFTRRAGVSAGPAHEAPWTLWLGPALLGGLTVLMGLFPGRLGDGLVQSAASAMAGRALEAHLHLWGGFNTVLWISLGALAAGLVLYRLRAAWLAAGPIFAPLARWAGPDRGYERALAAVLGFGAWQTRVLQNGSLRRYLNITILTVVGLVLLAMNVSGVHFRLPELTPIRWIPATIALLMALATLYTVHSRSRLRSILALGVLGFGIALLYTFYGAPDLAMTQLVIETLTVILLVLAFYHMPAFSRKSPLPVRVRDLLTASAGGAVMSLLVLAALSVETPTEVSQYYLDHSYADAHGRNIVNVILVDFRALDTLGEITVLTIAALGIFALLKFRIRAEDRS